MTLVAAALTSLAIAALVGVVNSGKYALPDFLQRTPHLGQYDLDARLSGVISDHAALGRKPRAFVGYLSDKDWAFFEFLCMAHASWRYIAPLAQENGLQFDIIVFAHERWLKEVSSICRVVDLEEAREEGYAGLFDSGEPNCLVVPYPPPPHAIWHGYPFINNVHFFADPLVADLLDNYGYVLKSDFDAFLTPSLIQHFPPRFQVGHMEYALLPATRERLARIADDLDLRHVGRSQLGPTWYGDARSLVAMANLSIPIMYHIYMHEFDHHPDGGLVQQWAAGEGWPLWSAGGAAMYATELAVNHLLDEFDVTDWYDHPSDSGRFVFTLHHIHCRQGSGDFSKHEFFRTHYEGVDVAKLDFNVARNYALSLAATTWRHVQAIQQQQHLQRLYRVAQQTAERKAAEAQQTAAGAQGHPEL